MIINKTAIILSGGKNSRMNYKTKAFLKINEKPFIEIILSQLGSYKEILISCNNISEYSYLENKVNLIRDKIVDIGPMGGIHSCLAEAKFDECLFVATDMPFLNKNLLDYLGRVNFEEDALIPIVNNKKQPLCGVYKRKIIKVIEDRIKDKDYKLNNLLDNLNVKYLTMDNEKFFFNINTVKEYEDLKRV